MKKIFSAAFHFIPAFIVIYGDIRFTQFSFIGEISLNNSAHVKFQSFLRSKQICAAQCLDDLDCSAIELCTHRQICRITTGSPGTYMASSNITCRRYLMNITCKEGYWDRLQNRCVIEMTTSITADLLTDSTSSESATAELTDSTTPATDNNSTTDSATSSQTTTDSAISSQTTTDAATSSQIATDATTTDAVTPQTTTDAVTPQTTAVACFDCECAITVAGITVTGPRKFNLSNNKTVICILDAVQNHKWTVIQRRFSTGSQSFDQDWIDYENGFGTLASEFWIGNKYIHELTSIYGNTHLLIEMVAGTGNMGFAEYTFFIDDAIQDYRLHVSNYVGNRGDPLTSTGTCTECADGMKFTTRDRDNDMQNLRNCATYSRGGWWHNACQRSNLNGQFGQSSYVYGLNWDGFMDISSVEMKVRKP